MSKRDRRGAKALEEACEVVPEVSQATPLLFLSESGGGVGKGVVSCCLG